MRARLVVFPVKGRNWCFSRSVDPLLPETAAAVSHTPRTLKQLWYKFSSSNQHNSNNVELLVDFISHKVNLAWIGLEKAPYGSLKNKIHGLGLKLLAREKPSEMFLKSISKEIKFTTSAPKVTAYCHEVLPLPNVPFFWILYRTYSHWRALQGSEKLFQLVSDHSHTQNSAVSNVKSEAEDKDSEQETSNLQVSPRVLHPSGELYKLVSHGGKDDGLSKSVLSDICAIFKLNTIHVLKYRDSK